MGKPLRYVKPGQLLPASRYHQHHHHNITKTLSMAQPYSSALSNIQARCQNLIGLRPMTAHFRVQLGSTFESQNHHRRAEPPNANLTDRTSIHISIKTNSFRVCQPCSLKIEHSTSRNFQKREKTHRLNHLSHTHNRPLKSQKPTSFWHQQPGPS